MIGYFCYHKLLLINILPVLIFAFWVKLLCIVEEACTISDANEVFAICVAKLRHMPFGYIGYWFLSLYGTWRMKRMK